MVARIEGLKSDTRFLIPFTRSREGDMAQYPVNQQIVAGEPVVFQHYRT
jgi:hypothetical protein